MRSAETAAGRTDGPQAPPPTTLVLGAGLIGGLTARLLLEAGDRVVLADLQAPALRADDVAAGRLHTLALDVRDMDRLCTTVRQFGVQRIVHTAALLSTAIRRDPLAGIAVNILGTAHVLECARRFGLGRVVLASSTTVGYNAFARHGPHPLHEDDPMRPLTERPGSLYAVTKLTGEHLALTYHQLYGVDAVSLRYAAVLGGDLQTPTSVPGRLMAHLAAGGDGTAPVRLDDPLLLWGGREEFVDARDCARANVAALLAPKPIQRVYHIAPGDWHTLEEFVAAMQQVFPRLRVEAFDEPTTGFAGFAHRRPAPSDVNAAREDLGFSCQYRLAQTLADWCGGKDAARP